MSLMSTIEFNKLLNEDSNNEIDENNFNCNEICLISGEKLTENYTTLSCGHKFNYIQIYNEVKSYKSGKHNLLVNQIGTTHNNSKFQYKINGQSYIVPNIGFQLKLWDFDFACIPGLIDNSKVDADWTSKINIDPVKNRYYDIHYFFNTLTKKGFFPEFWTEPEIPQRIKDFVRRVVPDKFRKGDLVSDRGRVLSNEEYLTPDEILKTDKLFKIMRVD